MIILALIALGALLGVLLARKRKGTRLDMLHHAGTMAILGAVVGIFVTILLARIMG